MSKVDSEVVIVGAGSTGLLLAQGLKAAGIPFRIFERHAADYVSREWSMSLHWGTEFLNKVLPPELLERLDEINVDPNYDFLNEKGFIQCNGETGEVILVMQGVMPRRVSRSKLRSLLSEGLNIEYGKSLDKFTVNNATSPPTITAQFVDSSNVTSHILVGADGSRSRIRHLMVNDSKLSDQAETPYTIVNFPYSYPAAVAEKIRGIHPVFKVAYHPKLNMMYMSSLLSVPDPKTGNVTFQNLLSWKGSPTLDDLKDPAARLARFKEVGEQFAEPYKQAALGVEEGFEGLYVDRGTQWDPRPVFKLEGGQSTWNGNGYSGCVTLAGDAAHPMLPHRGQGLNNGLEDASTLLTALTSALKPSSSLSPILPESAPTLQATVAAYEAEMVARGGLEVEITAKAAMAAHNWDMMMQSPMFKHGANKVQSTSS